MNCLIGQLMEKSIFLCVFPKLHILITPNSHEKEQYQSAKGIML